MRDLPTIDPGYNFERDVLLRSWLASMNDVPVSDDFDAMVDRAVRRRPLYRRPFPYFLAGLVIVVILLLLPRPDHAVVIPKQEPTVDLYNLPPAPVVEHPVRADPPPNKKRARRVVAGY